MGQEKAIKKKPNVILNVFLILLLWGAAVAVAIFFGTNIVIAIIVGTLAYLIIISIVSWIRRRKLKSVTKQPAATEITQGAETQIEELIERAERILVEVSRLDREIMRVHDHQNVNYKNSLISRRTQLAQEYKNIRQKVDGQV